MISLIFSIFPYYWDNYSIGLFFWDFSDFSALFGSGTNISRKWHRNRKLQTETYLLGAIRLPGASRYAIKNGMAFEKQHFRRPGRFFGSGIEISTIFLDQIVDIGLNFNLEGSKIKKKRKKIKKNRKLSEQPEKSNLCYNYPRYIYI